MEGMQREKADPGRTLECKRFFFITIVFCQIKAMIIAQKSDLNQDLETIFVQHY